MTQFLAHKKQEIQGTAIAEILNPTFDLTRQFLAVNKIVFEENMPFVEDIIVIVFSVTFNSTFGFDYY